LKIIFFGLVMLISWTIVAQEATFERWPAGECKKVSAAAGSYLYVSGFLVSEADRLEKEGKNSSSQETLKKALLFSELSRNAAEAFSSFCKK